jgi:predicted RNA-binding Zn-ribbon protein involved in translation (DUF1610 family)
MDLTAYLKGLKKTSKQDDIPGTVEEYLEEPCPACGKKLKIMKPCCSSKQRTKVCSSCGWKAVLE